MVFVLLSASVERCFVSRMQDFFSQFDSSHTNVVIYLKDLYLPVFTYSFVTLSNTLSNTDHLNNSVLLSSFQTC